MSYEPISVFDIFKIGVGPSSSHTLGPWRAAQQFLAELEERGSLQQVMGIRVLLFGSLAKTGVGHGTDIAVQMGLMGADPVSFAVEEIQPRIRDIADMKRLLLAGRHEISFDPREDIVYLLTESLPFHSNALQFQASLQGGDHVAATFYSIGGGFVVKEGKAENKQSQVQIPFPVNNARDLLHWCIKTGMAIHELVMENELGWRTEAATRDGIQKIWSTMLESMYRGCHTEGFLPGGLQVKRRASALNKRLLRGTSYQNPAEWMQAIRNGGKDFPYILDWVSCFALAVNEENASFGRVVTAPTNGAAGVIPAVLMYSLIFVHPPDTPEAEAEMIQCFLCTAAEIGSIFKKGATISAAMGGCQAEIGVSSAMAAAALAEAMGGSQRQAMMAAEIAMEHHLGMTCDPIAGLVQVPCIERNTMGAIKAITAAQLALQSTPDFAKVSLDAVIKTMWDTAQDMSQKYKETADGGLAVHVPLSLVEC